MGRSGDGKRETFCWDGLTDTAGFASYVYSLYHVQSSSKSNCKKFVLFLLLSFNVKIYSSFPASSTKSYCVKEEH